MENSVKVVGWINLDRLAPRRSVSIGAKQFLKESRQEVKSRALVNKMWGGFINNK